MAALPPELRVMFAVVGRVLVRWVAAPHISHVRCVDQVATALIVCPTLLRVVVVANADAFIRELLVFPAQLAAIFP